MRHLQRQEPERSRFFLKHRIRELDAARGVCILGMVAVHAVYDLTVLFPVFPPVTSSLFLLLKEQGSILFFLISGICATLGSRPVKRGSLVFGCGLLCAAVTRAMALLGFDSSIVIRFGVLQCLGACMLLWPVFRRAPVPLLAGIGLAVAGTGLWFARLQTALPFLYPLGLCREDFSSGDYFPLFPYLGFFLLGAVLGKTLYKTPESLLSEKAARTPLFRFFQRCGRQSLLIYLFHQPVLALGAGMLYLIRSTL